MLPQTLTLGFSQQTSADAPQLTCKPEGSKPCSVKVFNPRPDPQPRSRAPLTRHGVYSGKLIGTCFTLTAVKGRSSLTTFSFARQARSNGPAILPVGSSVLSTARGTAAVQAAAQPGHPAHRQVSPLPARSPPQPERPRSAFQQR